MDKSEVFLLVLILGAVAALVSYAVYYIFGRSFIGIMVLAIIILVLLIIRFVSQWYLTKKSDTSKKKDK